VRHHFQQATGLSHKQVTQIERAQRAAHLLKGGVSILDTVYELGYYDQPHMTRALKQWVGYTPAQLYRSDISCHFLQDPTLLPDYNVDVLTL
jgi:AraC-like DNA-binding protein